MKNQAPKTAPRKTLTLRERFEHLSADFSHLQIQNDFLNKQYEHCATLLEDAQNSVASLQTQVDQFSALYELACRRADGAVREMDLLIVNGSSCGECPPKPNCGLFVFKVAGANGSSGYLVVQAEDYDSAIEQLSSVPSEELEYVPNAVAEQFQGVAWITTVG